MLIKEILSENEFNRYAYGRGIRRGDLVKDKSGKQYTVHGVEGGNLTIDPKGNTIPLSNATLISKNDKGKSNAQ